MEVLTDGPELKRETKSYAALVHEDSIGGLEERFSSWPRLKRSLVWCYVLRKSYSIAIEGTDLLRNWINRAYSRK